jgi:steroid 5-alpha reductase family enzyme
MPRFHHRNRNFGARLILISLLTVIVMENGRWIFKTWTKATFVLDQSMAEKISLLSVFEILQGKEN